jgi:ubiquinone/menaquinone biosynthesis C-methylase UbiE
MIALRNPIRSSVKRLSQMPIAFDWLRWILEGGFSNHRRLISRNFPSSPRKVLDCGCGTGIYAKCFPRKSYVGIDLSASYIERARSCYPGYRFQVMDAMSLGFEDGTFDAVIVSGVIHHLSGPESVGLLSEVSRVLRPGGILLLWEDIPTRSRVNVIGQLVHKLDVGQHIREADSYKELLSTFFTVQRMEPMRSGFMDYITLTARKPSQASEVPGPCFRPVDSEHSAMGYTQQISSAPPTE